MALPLCGTFDYVAVVPDDPAAYGARWPVALLHPVERRGDRLADDRLVGHSPTLRITDAGMTPDAPRPETSPFARPMVLRSRITLTASRRRDATVRAASFLVAQGLVSALRPRDVLHMARTGCAGLGLSVIRDGQLVAAAGAVNAVPLANVDVRMPMKLIDEVEEVLKRHDPEFTYADLFSELPVALSVGDERRLRYRGRFEIGAYHVYVAHGFRPGMPGVDMCVAISLKGACSVVAANASAQLLALDDLTVAEWWPRRWGAP